MNGTIFSYTFRRFFDWTHVILGCMMMLFIAFFVALGWSTKHGILAEMCRWLLFGPTLPFVISSIIVMPQVANSQQRKDGEYLSLLFTRPLSRTTYILTKWLSAATFTFLAIIAQALLATLFAMVMQPIFNLTNVPNMIDGYALIDVASNSLTFSALAMLLCACPSRIRTWLALGVLVVLFTLMGSFGLTILTSGANFMEASKSFLAFTKFVSSFFLVSVDSYHLINTAGSPLTNIIIHISNVVLYLALAAFILCQREFFYAND